jgi:hypothetical protein
MHRYSITFCWKCIYIRNKSNQKDIMKKITLTFFLACGIAAIGFAQSGKIMPSAGAGIIAPACTNCSTFAGIELAGGYAVTEKIVASLNVGIFSKSEASKVNIFSIGISGEYYFKEAFKGFYASPDITFISTKEKYNDVVYFDESNITIGLNLGWAIGIGENFRIIPHFGYGTWFENSDGRITGGLKLGYKL